MKIKRFIKHHLKAMTRLHYTIAAVLLLLLISGSVFAYHTIHNSAQTTERTGNDQTGTLKVSDEPSNNLTLGNGNSSTEPASTDDGNATQTPSQTPGQSTKPTTPSKAGCTYSDIPYTTKQQDDSSLPEGQTRSTGGSNGSKKTCTDARGNVTSETVMYPPTDKTVYVGTYTSQQAFSDSQATCRSKGYVEQSTQFGDCVASEMHKKGYSYQNGSWVYTG